MLRKSLVTGFLLLLALTGCQGNTGGDASQSSQPEQPVSELVGSKDAVVSRQGGFEDAERPTSGTVELVQSGETYHVVLESDFQTSKGPDLQVVLHRSKNLLPELAPPTFSLTEGDYVVLGGLKSLKGQQTYPVPIDVNIADYGSVAIWCEKFNATFGTANLADS